MATAEIHKDPANGFPWGRQWSVSEGDIFVKSFLVDTDDLDTAILASGLPLRMESYSASFPNHRCVSLLPFPNASKSSKVIATYAPPGSAAWGGSGTPPPAPEPPTPNTTFCEWRSANESVTLFSAVNIDDGKPFPRPYQINDGAGMPAYAGRIEIDVWVYYPPAKKPDFLYFRTLQCDKKTNKETNLVLPPTRGTSNTVTVLRNQLLYMGFRHLLTPTLQECVVHTLWLAENHNFFWTPAKADGSTGTVADLKEDVRYQQADFTPIWVPA